MKTNAGVIFVLIMFSYSNRILEDCKVGNMTAANLTVPLTAHAGVPAPFSGPQFLSKNILFDIFRQPGKFAAKAQRKSAPRIIRSMERPAHSFLFVTVMLTVYPLSFW